MSDKTKYYLKWAAIGAVAGFLIFNRAMSGRILASLIPINFFDVVFSGVGATLAVLIAWLLQRKAIKNRSVQVKGIILIIALLLASFLFSLTIMIYYSPGTY